MLDRSFIKEQVDKLIEEKGYDNRITPLLSAFFIAVSERYNYTQEDLESDIDKYKSRVSKIGFYNIGIDDYIYKPGKELVYDREIVEDLSERNIETFIKTIIKSSSVITKGNENRSAENILQMSALVNVYEYSDALYRNINNMIANGLEVDPEEIPQIRENISKKMEQTDRQKNPNEYNYYNETGIVLSEIDRRIQDIQKGDNAREAYKSIYALLILNYRNKIMLIGEDSIENYMRLQENFNEFKSIFNINEDELDSVDVNGRGWNLKVNELLAAVEEEFKDVKRPELSVIEDDDKPKTIYFDRKQIIREQAEKNAEVDNSITEEQIRQKVSKLIEEKKYPKEFETVIHEFFKRSVDEFGWDRETLEKKIENLARNVNNFEYSTKKEKNDGVHTIAYFNATEKKITINPIAMTLSNTELATTIMHELKHATDLTVRENVKYEDSFKREVQYRRA